MPLTDLGARNAKPVDSKQVKKFDGGGLYLLVRANGSKLWQMAYRFAGKPKTLSFGTYPEVNLATARSKREDARRLLRDGIDPSVAKKLSRLADEVSASNTLEAVVRDYLRKLRGEGLADVTMSKKEWLLGNLAKPLLKRPINDIRPIEILSVLTSIEGEGKRETAHRLRSELSRVYRYAVASLRADNDPTFALKGALKRVQVQSRPALTDPTAFGRMLTLIYEYDGWPTLTAALKIQCLCFQRPLETRSMEWVELDRANGRWTIPASKMKMRVEHDVPLSRQAIAILDEIETFSGGGRYVFPSLRSPSRPLSENAMNSALRRMGISQPEHCAHGFRSSASTILNSTGKWHQDWIERQLAHIDTNEVRRIYNRAQYWPERVHMMQSWADLCDELRNTSGAFRPGGGTASLVVGQQD